MKRPILTAISALALLAPALPAQADTQIIIRRNPIGHSLNEFHDQFGYESDHYPLGDRPSTSRIIIRNGVPVRYQTVRREVIVVPQPIIIQQPVATQPTLVPLQTRPPRTLHGQKIDPLDIVVAGQGVHYGYEGPGMVYPELTTFSSGQVVTATQRAGGGDGYNWYLVVSTAGQNAWIREDSLLIRPSSTYAYPSYSY